MRIVQRIAGQDPRLVLQDDERARRLRRHVVRVIGRISWVRARPARK
jgi:hypothetical protein